jgi:hypothetical protein
VRAISASTITLGDSSVSAGTITAGTTMAAATPVIFGTLRPVGYATLSSSVSTGTIYMGATLSATMPMTGVQVTAVSGSTITLSSNLPAAVTAGTFRVAGYVPRILSGLQVDTATGSTLTLSGVVNSGLYEGMVVGGGTSASGVQEIPSGTFVRSVAVSGTSTTIVLNGSLNTSIFSGTLSFATFPYVVVGTVAVRANSKNLFVQNNAPFNPGSPVVGRIRWLTDNYLNMTTAEVLDRSAASWVVGLNVS